MRADLFGTLVFVVALAVGVPFKSDRWAQVIVVVVSVVLFAVGVAASLWADRSLLAAARGFAGGNRSLADATRSLAGARSLWTERD